MANYFYQNIFNSAEKWPKSKSSTEAEVEAEYKIQFIDEKETNDSNQCTYKGYYAEGKITFTFFLKKEPSGKEEWRIIRLIDEALSEEEIRGNYKVAQLDFAKFHRSPRFYLGFAVRRKPKCIATIF